MKRHEELCERALREHDMDLLLVAADDAEESGDLRTADSYRRFVNRNYVIGYNGILDFWVFYI